MAPARHPAAVVNATTATGGGLQWWPRPRRQRRRRQRQRPAAMQLQSACVWERATCLFPVSMVFNQPLQGVACHRSRATRRNSRESGGARPGLLAPHMFVFTSSRTHARGCPLPPAPLCYGAECIAQELTDTAAVLHGLQHPQSLASTAAAPPRSQHYTIAQHARLSCGSDVGSGEA